MKLSGTHRLDQEKTRSVEKDVLKMILAFNSPRISCYLGELKKSIGRCLEYCKRQTSANGEYDCTGMTRSKTNCP
jgi:hypothetical protein